MVNERRRIEGKKRVMGTSTCEKMGGPNNCGGNPLRLTWV
jgi:hypothetical protein